MSKRRGKGDGGLVQRHDHPTCPPLINGHRAGHHCRGRWVGTLVVQADGRKGRKSVYGHTKREAKLRLDQAIRDRDTGMLVAKTVTVESFMTDWLERRRKPPKPLKPQTWRGYKSKVHAYIIPALGRHKLTALKAEHIERMYDDMRARGLAEATVRQTHAILQRALKDAIRRDKLARSPMDRVDPPGTQTNDRAQFTPMQAAVVLAAAGDDARWWLALLYGWRQGECLGLGWEDVDFARDVIAVDETLQTDYDGGLIFGDPKTKASKRPLPMVPLLSARLRLHWENEGRPTTGLVFHRNGKPIDPKADWKAWRALIDRATLPPLSPLPYIALHAARNTAASMMEAAGIPDRLVMQILGQSQVRTTHRYQTADEDRIRSALGGVAGVLALEE
jgi:integrase